MCGSTLESDVQADNEEEDSRKDVELKAAAAAQSDQVLSARRAEETKSKFFAAAASPLFLCLGTGDVLLAPYVSLQVCAIFDSDPRCIDVAYKNG